MKDNQEKLKAFIENSQSAELVLKEKTGISPDSINLQTELSAHYRLLHDIDLIHQPTSVSNILAIIEERKSKNLLTFEDTNFPPHIPDPSEILVTFDHDASVGELTRSLSNGPIDEKSEKHILKEELVASFDGLKISIFAREHPPPHFRVSHHGKTGNYRIKDCEQINGELREFKKNIRKWHKQNKSLLIERWNATRPTDCPVGPYKE